MENKKSKVRIEEIVPFNIRCRTFLDFIDKLIEKSGFERGRTNIWINDMTKKITIRVHFHLSKEDMEYYKEKAEKELI